MSDLNFLGSKAFVSSHRKILASILLTSSLVQGFCDEPALSSSTDSLELSSSNPPSTDTSVEEGLSLSEEAIPSIETAKEEALEKPSDIPSSAASIGEDPNSALSNGLQEPHQMDSAPSSLNADTSPPPSFPEVSQEPAYAPFPDEPQQSLESTPTNENNAGVTDTSPEQAAPAKPQSSYTKIRPTIEVKGGYFFFSESKMRDVFDEGGGDVQLCGTYPVWRWLQVYGSIEYLERHGRSLNGHQRTSIWEVPLSLGLKPVFTIVSGVQYYFTLGPRYFFVHQHNHSSYVDKDVSKNGLGGFVNTGFNFLAWEHFLIDIFGEYSYKRMHFHPSHDNTYGRSVQIGGFTFGGGLGYAF